VLSASGARVPDELAKPPDPLVPGSERRHGRFRPLAAPRGRP
jgi:hypothetical protein